MFYPLPVAKVVNRERFLISLCSGKDVVHMGAAQANDDNDLGVYGSTIDPKTFLHSQISAVAKQCIGIDYNKESINFLHEAFGIQNIHFANIEDKDSLSCVDFVPEIILMGEIIEHLPNPGFALENVRNHLMSDKSILVVTMPNALDSSNFLYGLLRREAHDPDHVAFYSPRLFERLCEKVGLRVIDVKYYQSTMSASGRNYYQIDRLVPRKLFLFLYYNLLLRINPGFSNGIVVTAKRA